MLCLLHPKWAHYIGAVIEAFPRFSHIIEHLQGKVPHYEGATAPELRHLFYAEQWAFALALHDLALPYAVLPLSLNFPTIYSGDQRPARYIQDRFIPHGLRPLLVHHHHQDEGGLRPTGYAEPDRVIGKVNRSLWPSQSPVEARRG